jgi:hypothetical protein
VTKSWSAHSLRLEAVAEGVPLRTPAPGAGRPAHAPLPPDDSALDGAARSQGGASEARVQGWLADSIRGGERSGMIHVPAACHAPNPLARAPVLPPAAPGARPAAVGAPGGAGGGGGGGAGVGGAGGLSGARGRDASRGGRDGEGEDDDFDISLAQVTVGCRRCLVAPPLPDGAAAATSTPSCWHARAGAPAASRRAAGASRAATPPPPPPPRPAPAPSQIIPAEELTLIERIGQGAEGRVFLGRWNHIEVAAKEFFTGEEAGGEEGHLGAQVGAACGARGARAGCAARGAGLLCSVGAPARDSGPDVGAPAWTKFAACTLLYTHATESVHSTLRHPG